MPQQTRGGRGANRRNFRAVQVTAVPPEYRQALKEKTHGVGAGKQQPLISSDSSQGLIQRSPVRRRGKRDGSPFQAKGAHIFQTPHQITGLLPTPSDQNPLAKQRALLVPVDGVAQGDHLSNHHQGRWSYQGLADHLGNILQGSHHRTLLGGGRPAHHRHRGLRVAAVTDQIGADVGQIFNSHIENNGTPPGGQRIPGDPSCFFAGVLMAGDKSHRRSKAPMSNGNPGVGGGGAG